MNNMKKSHCFVKIGAIVTFFHIDDSIGGVQYNKPW